MDAMVYVYSNAAIQFDFPSSYREQNHFNSIKTLACLITCIVLYRRFRRDCRSVVEMTVICGPR